MVRGASAPGRTEVTPPFAVGRCPANPVRGADFQPLVCPSSDAGQEGPEAPDLGLASEAPRGVRTSHCIAGRSHSAALGSSGQTSLERAVLGQPLEERDRPYMFSETLQ